MHQILNTTHLENNNLMNFTEKTMMTSNHLLENMTPSIAETIITQFLTKLTHTEQTEQTNNTHHTTISAPQTVSYSNQTETECTKTVFSEEEEKSM